MDRRMTITATEGDGLLGETTPTIVHLLERLRDTTGSAHIALKIPGPEAGSLSLAAGSGPELDFSDQVAVAIDRASALVLGSAEPFAAGQDPSLPLEMPLDSDLGLIQSLTVLPVIQGGQTLGVAVLVSLQPSAYGPTAMALAEGYLSAVAAVLGNMATTARLSAAQESLNESEHLFKTLTELIPEAVFVITGTQVVYANPFAERLFDVVDAGGFVGRTALDFVHPEYRAIVSERQRLRNDQSTDLPAAELKMVTLKGQVRDVEAAFNDGFEFLGQPSTLFMAGDITARKQFEEVLKASEARGNAILKGAAQGIVAADEEGKIVLANAQTESLFGYSREELIGQRVDFLVHSELRDTHRDHRSTYASDPYSRPMGTGLELFAWRKDGTRFPVEVGLSAVETQEGKLFLAFITDDTARKTAQERTQAALAEKEVMLKEINHRVKNNLQIIASLLNLQSRGTTDRQALHSFQVSQNRIKAMALVHDKLYRSGDLAHVDLANYIHSLGDELKNSYGIVSTGIKFSGIAEQVYLGVDMAIPCGIIINELVPNALKYAFPNGESGEVVVLLRSENGQCVLTVKDNGVGISDPTDSSSLGFMIVESLTKQLNGVVEFGAGPGAEITVRFPLTAEETLPDEAVHAKPTAGQNQRT